MKLYIKADNELTNEYDVADPYTGDSWGRMRNAQYTASPELLEIYAFDPTERVRLAVVKNPNTPTEVLDGMIYDSESRVRQTLASSKRISPESLDKLAEDSDRYVRFNVAENRNASPETLARLANDPEQTVVGAVAENTKTPADVLVSLLDKSSGKYAAASNSRTPMDEILARIDDPTIRNGLVHNRKFDFSMADMLLENGSYDIYYTLAKSKRATPELLDKISKKAKGWPLTEVIKNPKTSKKTLARIAEVQDERVQMYFFNRHAKYQDLTENIFDILSKAESKKVRAYTAYNTKSPDILRRLAADRLADVRYAVAYNRNTPEDVLRELALHDRSRYVRNRADYFLNGGHRWR